MRTRAFANDLEIIRWIEREALLSDNRVNVSGTQDFVKIVLN